MVSWLRNLICVSAATSVLGDPCGDLDILLGLGAGSYPKGNVCHALFWQGERGSSLICLHNSETRATCPSTNPVRVMDAILEVLRLTANNSLPVVSTSTPASAGEAASTETPSSVPTETVTAAADSATTAAAARATVGPPRMHAGTFTLDDSQFDLAEISFAVLGDTGHANTELQQTVRMVHNKIEASSQAVLMLGDNFYPRGVRDVDDEQFRTVFEEILSAGINLPFYNILGNHDWMGNPQAQVDYSTRNPKWIMPHFYYMKRFVGADFSVCVFALNTESLQSRAGTDAAQLNWLEERLTTEGARCTWKIVMGHHPIFDAGEYSDNARMMTRLLPVLERHRVHLYLSGHEHQSQVLYSARHSPVTFIVSGATAELRSRIQKTEHPFFVWSEPQKLVFLQLVISKNEFRYNFHRSSGGVDREPIYSATIEH